VAASEREVWQGWNRKGTVESEEDLDFEVAGKATVGGNGGGELIFLFEESLSSDSFFTGDRARAVNDCCRDTCVSRCAEPTMQLTSPSAQLGNPLACASVFVAAVHPITHASIGVTRPTAHPVARARVQSR